MDGKDSVYNENVHIMLSYNNNNNYIDKTSMHFSKFSDDGTPCEWAVCVRGPIFATSVEYHSIRKYFDHNSYTFV